MQHTEREKARARARERDRDTRVKNKNDRLFFFPILSTHIRFVHCTVHCSRYRMCKWFVETRDVPHYSFSLVSRPRFILHGVLLIVERLLRLVASYTWSASAPQTNHLISTQCSKLPIRSRLFDCGLCSVFCVLCTMLHVVHFRRPMWI